MLLRLAYLGVTNVFAILRLLPVSDRDKDVEILALRHQIAGLQRAVAYSKPDVSPAPRRTISGSGPEKSITVVGSVPHSPESITASTA